MGFNDEVAGMISRATIDLNQAFLAHLRGEYDRRNSNFEAVIKTLKEFLEAVTK